MTRGASFGQDSRRLALKLQARALEGDAQALPSIRQALSHSEPLVRSAAVMALSYYDGDDVSKRLLTALQDEDPTVQRAAEYGLMRRGRAVLADLHAYEKTAPEDVQKQIAEVMGSIRRRRPSSSRGPAADVRTSPDARSGAVAKTSFPSTLSEANLMMVAHDVRGIGMSIGLLLSEAAGAVDLTEDARTRILRAEAGLRTLQLILRGLLDERSPGGHPAQVSMSLQGVVDEAVSISEPIFRMYSVRWRTQWTAEDVVADLDRPGVLRAVCNLIWNACKHSRQNSEVLIKTRREPHHVVVEVHDQGPGLAASRAHELKEAFVRGDTQTQGWGLGLFIVSEVVHRHGGKFSVDDSNGGTRIELHFPAPPARV